MSLRDEAKKGFLRLPPGMRRGLLHALGRYAPWEEGFDFTPPRPAPGEVAGPPDFVGIGVQKAGTTWWYDLIVSHPRVSAHPGLHKERHYLDRFGAVPFSAADVAGYHGWFPRPPGTVTGEWTPDYFSYPWVPPLLRRAAPQARLLLLLRDPVDRFRSGLGHLERLGLPRDAPAVADAVERGFYAARSDGGSTSSRAPSCSSSSTSDAWPTVIASSTGRSPTSVSMRTGRRRPSATRRHARRGPRSTTRCAGSSSGSTRTTSRRSPDASPTSTSPSGPISPTWRRERPRRSRSAESSPTDRR